LKLLAACISNELYLLNINGDEFISGRVDAFIVMKPRVLPEKTLQVEPVLEDDIGGALEETVRLYNSEFHNFYRRIEKDQPKLQNKNFPRDFIRVQTSKGLK
jgi:hypothetical protein